MTNCTIVISFQYHGKLLAYQGNKKVLVEFHEMFGLGLHKQTSIVFKFIKFVYHEFNVLVAFIFPDAGILKQTRDKHKT